MWYIQCQELFHIDRNDNYVIRSICMDSVGILFQTILTILKTNGRKFCPALEYSFVLIQWNVGLANCNWGLAKCRPRRSRANNRTPTLSIQTGYRDSDSGTSYCSLLDKKSLWMCSWNFNILCSRQLFVTVSLWMHLRISKISKMVSKHFLSFSFSAFHLKHYSLNPAH